MPIKSGNKGIIGSYFGSTPIIKIYQGSNLVFQKVEEDAEDGLLRKYLRDELETINEKDFRNIETLGAYAIVLKSNLKNIYCPKSIIKYNSNSIASCKKLEDVVLPNPDATYSNGMFSNSVMEKLTISYTQNAEETMKNLGDLFNSSSHVIPKGVKEVIFNNDIMYVSTSYLEKITINGSNIDIPKSYCYYAATDSEQIQNHLKKFVINGSVKSVGDSAFKYTNYLSRVIFPEGLTTIGKSAFYMAGWTYIDLPSTIQSIGDDAFNGYSDSSQNALRTIIIRSEFPPEVGSNAFRTYKLTIKVPAEYLENYSDWNYAVEAL